MALKLRLLFIDNSDKKDGGRPVAYTVDGFTCGTVVTITADPVARDRWLLHRSYGGARFERVGRFYETPIAAVEYLESWASAMAAAAAKDRH